MTLHHVMNETTQVKILRKETGVRLPVDQIQKLDLLVQLNNGRRKRSSFICEAIDVFLADRLSKLTVA